MQVVSGLDTREWFYMNQLVEIECINLGNVPSRIQIWVVNNNKLLMRDRGQTTFFCDHL